MADVQVERGHIRLANQLFRALSLAKLSPVQRDVLAEAVWRQYGWADMKGAPEPFPMSPADVARRVGCTRESASRAINSLASLRILSKAPAGYLVAKDFDLWRCGFKADPSAPAWRPDRDETDTGVTKQTRTPCRDDHGDRDEMDTVCAPKSTPAVVFAAPLEPMRTRENHSSSSAGASAPVPTEDASEKIHALVARLGALTPRPISWPKWAGIVEQPTNEVEQLITWALGQQRPADAFLNCFAMDGTIKARKPTKTTARRGRRPTPYVQQEDDPRYFKPGEPMQTAESLAYIEKLRAKQQEEGR